jgi:hypothetical protein
MSTEVATGDLLRSLAIVSAKEDEAVRLALPIGLGELTVWRGCWETVVWAVESEAAGPTATVRADELRAAADRPMISIIDGLDGGGLRVGDADLPAVDELAPPPVPVSMLGGSDLNLPPSIANPYAPVLADVEQGACKVWIPLRFMQRLRQRQISRLRLFPELGSWYLSGLSLEDTHLVRISGQVNVY